MNKNILIALSLVFGSMILMAGIQNPQNPAANTTMVTTTNTQTFSATQTFSNLNVNGPNMNVSSGTTVTNSGTIILNGSSTYTAGTTVGFYNQTFQVGALTSTTPLYLNLTNQCYQTVALTNNATLASTNRAAGRGITLKLLASGADRSLVFPAWVFIGSAPSTNISSGKIGLLSVQFFGTNETDGVAAFSVQP